MSELKIWNTVHCRRCKELLGHTTDPNGFVLDYEHSNSGSCDNLMRGAHVTRPEMTMKQTQCYPLPDFDEAISDISLFAPEYYEKDADQVSQVPSDIYLLWAAQFLQGQGIDPLLQSEDRGDLRRLWHMLEMTHRRVHNMMDRASKDPDALVGGFYLSLGIMHEGVRHLMSQVEAKLLGFSK